MRHPRNGSILPGVFYFWKGERPRDQDAPEFEGTGEIKLESVDRANGYYIVTRSNSPEHFHVKTSGIYLRADPGTRPCWTARTPPSVRHSFSGESRNGGPWQLLKRVATHRPASPTRVATIDA